jgi:hypothetical protein
VNNRFLRRQDRRCLRSNAAGILASPESRFSFRFPQCVSLRSGLKARASLRWIACVAGSRLRATVCQIRQLVPSAPSRCMVLGTAELPCPGVGLTGPAPGCPAARRCGRAS